MRLSMWVLADWLKKYNPKTKIIKGNLVLKNARLFSFDRTIEKFNVYVGSTHDLLNTAENNVICFSGQDMIFLETEDIDQVLNDILDAFDFYNDWFEILHEQIHSGCSLQFLIDYAKNFFDDIVSMADPAYTNTTLSIPENMDMSQDYYQDILYKKIMRLDIIMEINRDVRVRETRRKNAYTLDNKMLPCRHVCVNLVINNQHIGWVTLLERNHPVTQGKMDIFSAYARILESWFSCNSTQSEFKSYQQFFLDVINGHTEIKASINQHFQSIGWDPADDKMIVGIKSMAKNDIMLTLSRHIEKLFPTCIGIFYEDYLVVICNLALISKSQFIQILKELSQPSKSLCGISYIFNDTEQARAYFEQTKIAIKYGNQKPGSLNECANHVIAYGLDIIKQNVQTDLRHPAVMILEKYDIENNSEMTKTLRTFLENERNYTKTSNILFIHKNSLKYRLSRINELTNVDLDSYHTRLHIMFSFFL